MPAVQLATIRVQSLVLRVHRHSRAILSSVRYRLEHILDTGALSGLQPPVALDLMPSLSGGFVARGLVRNEEASWLNLGGAGRSTLC